jgi:hypothetical protein
MKDEEDLTDYTRRFKTTRDVYKSHIGSKMRLKKMTESDPLWDNTHQATQEVCYERASDKVLALLYLENADQSKYRTLLKG